MSKFFVAVGILTFLAAGAAQAEVLTVSASYNGLTDVEGVSADLPQFDPSLGTLQSVALSVDGFLTGTLTYTNTNAVGGPNQKIKVYFDWTVGVNSFGAAWNNLPPEHTPDGAYGYYPASANVLYYPWGDPPTEANGWYPANNANSHYYLPTTGNIVPQQTVVYNYGNHQYANATYGPTDSQFSFFEGTGTLPFNLEIPCYLNMTTYGSGTKAFQFATTAGANITATYTYVVPEPATLALLGFGALCLLRRR
jgi:hypothetical protein